MIELSTHCFPTNYPDKEDDWDWEFVCKGYIEPDIWDSIHKLRACKGGNPVWVYTYKALPVLIDAKGPIRVDGVYCRYKSKLAEYIMERTRPGVYQELKAKHDAKMAYMLAEARWRALPPRWMSAGEICRQLGLRPGLGRSGAFCSFCDSGAQGDAVIQDGKRHLWHLVDYRLNPDPDRTGLRWSELEIVEAALRAGELEHETQAPGTLGKIFSRKLRR
ncbi:hypothetical protein DOK_11881 [gamma proteobacterium BDW918]|nr:hypothetical protein DOK_11881 [gamma proteobacterium BDW918]